MTAICRTVAALLLTATIAFIAPGAARASTPQWLSVSSAGTYTCAIATDHALYCWGANTSGQLGVADGEPHTTPARVGTSTSWASVSAGAGGTTCGLRTSGALYCWGANTFGGLGLGDTLDRSTPTRVGTSTSWASVSSGAGSACAVHKSGALYCWGANFFGQLGLDDLQNRDKPTRVGASTSWSSVVTGSHTCALHQTGAIYCWGKNWSGEVGIGTTSQAVVAPKKIGTSSSWASVATGAETTCAVHRTGSLYCWGSNFYGQLGLGDMGHETRRTTPRKVGSSSTWVSVSGGGNHTCAVDKARALYCWGANHSWQLGLGTNAPASATPRQVGYGAAGVSAGEASTCARAASGSLYCWGDNTYGQLGLGDTVNRWVATKVG